MTNNGERTIDRALWMVKAILMRHGEKAARQFTELYKQGGANWSPVKRNKGNGRKHAIRHARNLRLSASRFRHGICR